ncbi:hypothetical protein DL96DRAFT_1685496 [Flagelloscypha sp. PMI_526]|nr:hypothetical protein DL96DRAFT_1685496 [Flagelloscypha sp. PMI_526]
MAPNDGDDETASQATDDDPGIPSNGNGHSIPLPPDLEANGHHPLASQNPEQPPYAGPSRPRPHYSLKYTLDGHTNAHSAVKLSPDDSLLASCVGWETVIEIWSPFAREFIGNLSGHTKGVSDLA